MQPAIFGLLGERLTGQERDFFREADPAGYILFRRNCANHEQLRALTDSLRALHGRPDLPILIDQEGGRVARLRPPLWPGFPAPGRFAALYEVAPISAIEAARLNAQAIAVTLRDCGINVDCWPVLDLRHAGAHDIVGDRALGSEPMQVAALGRAVIEGLRAGGVAAVVKHMPGHGRSMCDSHYELPVVTASEAELEADLEPFRTLAWAPMGMTAHVVYSAWDAGFPASLSARVIGEVIRGRIGFGGFLMSDDIIMQALTGSLPERACGVLSAGCDAVLHCSGVVEEMAAVAAALPTMTADARQRLDRAMATVAGVDGGPPHAELAARRDELLAYARTA